MKIIHTSDLHLDMCYSGSGMPANFGNRRRQSMRDVLHNIVKRAGAWPADALLIAGDLFELDRVSRDTILFLQSEFQSIPHVPIFIAPGNHDPYTPTSPYATAAWPENVRIFSRPDWESHSLQDGALTVYGFGFDGPDVSSNPFGNLRLAQGSGIHVAVAHGSERGHQPPDKRDYAPFDAADAVPEGLDYLALGHFHSTTRIHGPFRSAVYYSGCPEGHDFRELGVRHYLEADIEGGVASVTHMPSSRYVFTTHSIACDEFTNSQHLLDALRKVASAQERPQIARITLTGCCPPEVMAQLQGIYDSVVQEYEYLDLADRTDTPYDYEGIAREGTSLGAFVRTLNEEIADATRDGTRQMLVRARELGLAAFRKQPTQIRGMDQGQPQHQNDASLGVA